MYRKWKGVAALGMAVLIGCLMPMGTMMAAEDNPEVVQEVETGFEADAVDNDEAILGDNENAGVEEDTVTDENVDDEINADDEIADDEVSVDDENANDEVNADDEIVDDEVNSDNDGNDGIEVMSETEAGDVEVQASADVPVIDIKLNEQSCKYDLGGTIEYKYFNDTAQKLAWSASLNGDPAIEKLIKFYYFLDTNPGITAMGEEQVVWSSNAGSPIEYTSLSNNTTYVLYVKAEANGQTVYARSCGIVVDTEAPKVTGVEDGKSYSEGTTFNVSDANLESVTVNGQTVTPASDGSYQITAAADTTCDIIAKDKAGNQTVVSNITVTARTPSGAISVDGTYSLTASKPYTLGEGQWQVAGDTSVYSGGNTFYVGTDGNYSFTKR